MQTTSQLTPMMRLLGNSQSDKAILSLFLSDTEESEFSNFWAEKNWFMASTAFWHFLLHLFGLRSSCTFYLLLSVCERMSEWMSYALPLFAAPVWVLSCYLQFASVSLCLFGCMCLIDVWSTVVVVFKGRVHLTCCVALQAGNYSISCLLQEMCHSAPVDASTL